MGMVREISGKLYSIRKVSGKQRSTPVDKAVAETRQQLTEARARLAEATASYETLRDQLRVALAGGDWQQARALQKAVDQARHAEQEVDAEIMRLTDQLTELEDAVIQQRVRQQQARFEGDMAAMLARHPIPTPPEAA